MQAKAIQEAASKHLSTVKMAMSVATQLMAPMMTADSSEEDLPEPRELNIWGAATHMGASLGNMLSAHRVS